MAKKLFVGNLSFDLTQDQFKDIFAAYGAVVSANIVMDKFSGRSKGFGFVEFENDADAMKAMAELNDSEQAGRNIAVKEAIARTEQPVEAQPVIEAPVADTAPVMETPVTETPVVEETATEEPAVEEPTTPEEPTV